ncbi:MAG: IS4 family transposase, partial [Pseudomonadales bacterium]|nr:IS4 family transposase [Pseudomonadales bacterium]
MKDNKIKKQDFWNPIQAIIEEKCGEFDKVWQKRKRIIDTQFLVIFILKLVMSKNKQGYASVLNQLWESKELSALQPDPVSASSVCEARKKMPETIFTELNQHILAFREKTSPLPLWYGHRVFAVDGSRINVPRELLNAGYKAVHNDQYYPQGLLSTLYHLGSGLIYDGIFSAAKSERACLLEHMECLQSGDVLVLDRGYFSYLILSEAIRKGVHLICRMQGGTVNKAVKRFLSSDSVDEIISYEPSLSVKYESRKQGYDIEITPIKLRLIKYTINGGIYVCSTTLLDSRYPPLAFSKVYHGRWGIEELYKISKEFIDVEDFHSQSERGVKQECYAHILMINMARIFESEALKKIPPPPSGDDSGSNPPELKDSYWQDFCGDISQLKINFKNCLLVIGRSLEKLLLPIEKVEVNWVSSLVRSISRVR